MEPSVLAGTPQAFRNTLFFLFLGRHSQLNHCTAPCHNDTTRTPVTPTLSHPCPSLCPSPSPSPQEERQRSRRRSRRRRRRRRRRTSRPGRAQAGPAPPKGPGLRGPTPAGRLQGTPRGPAVDQGPLPGARPRGGGRQRRGARQEDGGRRLPSHGPPCR